MMRRDASSLTADLRPLIDDTILEPTDFEQG
jgi:hypothetical protein